MEGQGGSNHQNYHFLLQQHQLRPAPAAGGSYRMRGGCGGEIVEVQGGHIMRSTGRKDRHSKVCTAKGPRDRRVRLSAHTAIQFYDVQDRLGYDRPSKAVDWLIKNAKAAIDELEKLPPWNPTAMVTTTDASTPDQNNSNNDGSNNSDNINKPEAAAMDEEVAHITAEPAAATYDGFGSPSTSSAFFPPSMDSDSIADTIKSFFPLAGPSSSSCIGFQSYQTATATEHQQQPLPFPPKANPGAQDLRLSLQSYQDPMLVQHHQQTPASAAASSTGVQHHTPFFSTSTPATAPLPLVYDTTPSTNGWVDHSNHPRGTMASWIAGGVGGYVFSVPQPPLHQALSQSSHVITQRGPLQSSNPSANFAWAVEPSSVSGLQDHGGVYSSAFGFTPSSFSSFQIPSRAQGEEQLQDGGYDKSSSTFSASRR